MKKIIFPLAFFSLLSISHYGYSEQDLSSDSLEEKAFFEPQEMDLEKELLSLEDEILSPVPDLFEEKASLSETLPVAPLLSQAEPLATSIESSPLQDQSEDPELVQNDFIDPIPSPQVMTINLQQVFAGSPLTYSLLLVMSVSAISLWLYSMLRLRYQTRSLDPLAQDLRSKLLESDFQEAFDLCQKNSNVLSRMVFAGLSSRKYGLQTLLDSMKSEGKRISVSSWQRLSLLQDIAIIAPMLGLLGTVMGMFYAFYDLNRSSQSIDHLFDGLGISVGTTVAGIAVAILALTLHSIAKFRLVRVLARVENEATTLAHLMTEHN